MSLALVDCNNFFASCERVFNPRLEKKPIVVLSSNDGCVIARSEEAKQLGIPMGAPAFMYKALFKKYDVHVFSSNFSLYLDLSRRVMQIVKSYTPRIQIYSIDEAFLSLDGVKPEEYTRLAYEIREKVVSWTGITVSIGIAPTKTLAKVANHAAKRAGGVQVLDESNRRLFLEAMPVQEVWGIGARLAERLRKHAVYTAWQFQARPDDWIKKTLSVVGLRLAFELRGVCCLDIEEVAASKKSISTAKSFERALDDADEIAAIVADYASKIAADLRREKKKASCIQVFLPETDRAASAVFEEPTHYTPTLIRCAKKCFYTIFEKGRTYKRVGVLLSGLVPSDRHVQSLFRACDSKKQERVMQALDAVNERFGKRTLFYAAQRERSVKSQWLTPRATTRWDELLVVYTS